MKSQTYLNKNNRSKKKITLKQTTTRTFARKKKNSRSFLSDKHQANPISLLISSQEEAVEAGDTNSSYMYSSLTGLRFCKTYEFPLCRVAS